MDVAPEQLVSIAARSFRSSSTTTQSRADGSNMQRQAVPLLNPQTPLVGTGLEEKVARDSGAVVIARRAGTITSVTATRSSSTPALRSAARRIQTAHSQDLPSTTGTD